MRVLTSRDNPWIKHVHGLATSARERRKHGETLLDGAHLIAAALQRQWPLKAVVVAEHARDEPEIAALLAALPAELALTQVPDALFAHLSPVETPSGILALIDVPPPPPLALAGAVVALDGVQDPGNLGTILRTAAAAGVREVLLGEGCAQAWSPRVLRAAMGAHFVLAFAERVDLGAALADYRGRVLATGLTEGARALYDLDLRGPVAWLFGAEGQGVSAALMARADCVVTIPMAGAVESLNVGAAAAVCLFEQARQCRMVGVGPT